MKNKKINLLSVAILMILGMFVYITQIQYVAAFDEVIVTVQTSKDDYQLGELVPVSVKVTNNGSSSVYLNGNANLKIASEENGDYKFYTPPGPSVSFDAQEISIKIEPKQTIELENTILWNNKPKVSHLNPRAAKPFLEGKILTDYAFPKSGSYFLKAYVNVSKDGQTKNFESAPNTIRLMEPKGENLAFWNIIKTKGDFGYFLQFGDAPQPLYKTQERAEFAQKIEKLLVDYPNNYNKNSLILGLEKFRAKETSRQNFLQRKNSTIPKN